MNNLILHTDGTWEQTWVLADGEIIDNLDRLYLEINVERNMFDKIRATDFTAYLKYKNSYQEVAIFPGSIELEFISSWGRQSARISNMGYDVDPEDFEVEYEGIDISEGVQQIFVDINGPENYATAFIDTFKGKLIGNDEIIRFTFIDQQ